MTHVLLRAATAVAIFATLTVAIAAGAAPLPRKPALGVALQPTPNAKGAAVGTVFPGGTAASMDVRTGDVVTAVNGTRVASPGEVIALARMLSTGD